MHASQVPVLPMLMAVQIGLNMLGLDHYGHCVGCGIAWYCSHECREADLDFHIGGALCNAGVCDVVAALLEE